MAELDVSKLNAGCDDEGGDTAWKKKLHGVEMENILYRPPPIVVELRPQIAPIQEYIISAHQVGREKHPSGGLTVVERVSLTQMRVRVIFTREIVPKSVRKTTQLS